MKFQNPSFNFFLNGRTNKRTDRQAESNMLPTFSKLGALKRRQNRSQHLGFIFSNTFGCPHHVYKI